MSREIRIRVADPAGNTTIFVMDHVEREDYAHVAGQLLDIKDIGAEQVAFVTGMRSMEMCGLEFCGNASRAFGLMCIEGMDEEGRAELSVRDGKYIVPVDVSGTEGSVDVLADPDAGSAGIEMPVPLSISYREDLGGTLVDLGGIVHLAAEDTEASDEHFEMIRSRISEESDPPAIGVMFLSGDTMTPVVYVRDVDTVYYEGSCASGMTAVMAARTAGRDNGEYKYCLKQPGGELSGRVAVSDGRIVRIGIEGPVSLSEIMKINIDI